MTFRKLRAPAFIVACILAAAVALLQISKTRHEHQLQLLRFAKVPDYGSLHRFDPDRQGGHLLPNLDTMAVGETIDRPVRFVTNSKGFRAEKEYALIPEDGILRILLLGDSFIDGMRTDQHRTIGYLLEEELGKTSLAGCYRGVEVLISGHNNPANAWYYFQEHGRRYHPHHVILGVTVGNDLTWYSYKDGVLPTTVNNAQTTTLTLAEHPRQTGREKPDLLLPQAAYTEAAWADVLRTGELRVREYLAEKLDWFSYSVPPAMGPKRSVARHVYAAGFFTSLGLFYQPVLTEIEEMYQDFAEVLTGFDKMANATGTKFVAVFFPLRFQISVTEWRLLSRTLALKSETFDLTYPNRRIAEICMTADIACVDLLEDFAGREVTKLFRPRGDMHLNEEGQKLVALLLGKYILRELEPCTHRSG